MNEGASTFVVGLRLRLSDSPPNPLFSLRLAIARQSERGGVSKNFPLARREEGETHSCSPSPEGKRGLGGEGRLRIALGTERDNSSSNVVEELVESQFIPDIETWDAPYLYSPGSQNRIALSIFGWVVLLSVDFDIQL